MHNHYNVSRPVFRDRPLTLRTLLGMLGICSNGTAAAYRRVPIPLPGPRKRRLSLPEEPHDGLTLPKTPLFVVDPMYCGNETMETTQGKGGA